jgi:hypothetical protein
MHRRALLDGLAVAIAEHAKERAGHAIRNVRERASIMN